MARSKYQGNEAIGKWCIPKTLKLFHWARINNKPFFFVVIAVEKYHYRIGYYDTEFRIRKKDLKIL